MNKGIDVSHHNGTIDWHKVAGAGIGFAYAKASEGLGMIDGTLARNVNQAVGQGLRVGAYHFLRPDADAGLQAAHFVDAITQAGVKATLNLPPVVDVEFAASRSGSGGDAWAKLSKKSRADKVANYVRTIEAALGTRPMIYCSPGWWDGMFGTSADFSDYPLWVAHYGVDEPDLPGSWKRWTVWQKGDHGTVPGAGANSIDVDVWNGEFPA